MKLKLKILSLTFTTLLYSCSGQGKSQNDEKSFNLISEFRIDTKANFVYQDTKGNYWFSSNQEGIYKYDGRSILKYTAIEGLTEYIILRIEEDKHGNLFFDSPFGIYKFDGAGFEKLRVIPSGNEWQSQPSDLWFSMGWEKSGPLRYDGKNLYQLTFPKSPNEEEYYKTSSHSGINPYGVYSIYKDKNSVLFFGTSNLGVFMYDGKNTGWNFDKKTTETEGGGSFGIRSIIRDHNGDFWINRADQKFELNYSGQNKNIELTKSEGLQSPELANLYFLDMLTDQKGNIWMATYDKGIYKYDGQTVKHYSVRNKTENVNLSSYNTLTMDRQGNLWAGTQENGAYQFNGAEFEKYEPE